MAPVPSATNSGGIPQGAWGVGRVTMSKTLPTFFVVGAQKAKTTLLYYYLKQHPRST